MNTVFEERAGAPVSETHIRGVSHYAKLGVWGWDIWQSSDDFSSEKKISTLKGFSSQQIAEIIALLDEAATKDASGYRWGYASGWNDCLDATEVNLPGRK